jgi:hypothetical protein
METDAETRELVVQEAQRRLRAGQPTRRGELAAKFGVTERIVQDSIAVARDRNHRAVQAVAYVAGAGEWREFENRVVRACREAPTVVLEDLLRRLADLRRARN